MTDARTFDLDYRMTGVKDVRGQQYPVYSYGYDADNNLHTITDNVTPGEQPDPQLRRDRPADLAGGSVTYDSNSNILTVGGRTNTVPASSDRMSVSTAATASVTTARATSRRSAAARPRPTARPTASPRPGGTPELPLRWLRPAADGDGVGAVRNERASNMTGNGPSADRGRGQ